MMTDAIGLIVQKDGDGGDCLQRMGFWYEGRFHNRGYGAEPNVISYTAALRWLQNPPGVFIRYPIKYNDPKDTSRDQLVSNIRAIGLWGLAPLTLSRIFWKVLFNFSRYPNGDVAFLQDYARFARAFKAWWIYPIVLLGDIFLIGNSVVRIYKGRNYNDVGDDINHIGDLAQASAVFPTPFSWLAKKLYFKFRPSFVITAGRLPERINPKVDNKLGAVWALQWYFRPESGANTEFIDLWGPVVVRLSK